jgi:hypothetical protein
MFTRGVPQMRQSEGNKTAKRLSAIWPLQPRPAGTRCAAEAIEGLATAALAWLARILSPLLLKTASALPARVLLGRATLQLPAQIEYNGGRVR